MKQRYCCCVDLHVILRDERACVLLGERQNTGWADGYLGLPSGHLEEGEPATAGAVREAAEETGVSIRQSDLCLVYVMHHYTNSGRMALFFEATEWVGEIENLEPEKCAGWRFLPLDPLPDKIVPYVADALLHYNYGIRYAERGWRTP